MTILKDVLGELIGMFIGDAWLSAAIIVVIAVTAGLIELAGIDARIGGAVLLFGCMGVVLGAVRHAARQLGPAGKPSPDTEPG